MADMIAQRLRSHLQELIALDPAWKAITEDDLRRTEERIRRSAQNHCIVPYGNEEDDADERLDHYDMPPLSDEDCEALFADLPMGS